MNNTEWVCDSCGKTVKSEFAPVSWRKPLVSEAGKESKEFDLCGNCHLCLVTEKGVLKALNVLNKAGLKTVPFIAEASSKIFYQFKRKVNE